MQNIEVSDGHKPNKKTVTVSLPNFKRLKLKWIIYLIVAVAIAYLTYGYVHTKNQLNAAKNPVTAGKTEIQQIQSQISDIVALPPNDTPTLATVSDANKLRSQIFFKNVQDGDKVLIYPKSGTAILYRPSTKKVIEYAPVNLGNNTQ